MSRITAKLINTNRFIKDILGGFVGLINKEFNKKKRRREERIRKLVYDEIVNSPEMRSLSDGTLGIDVGIPANEDPAPLVAQAVVNSINIATPNFKVASNEKINGKLTIEIQPSNFSNLLNQSFGSVVTEKGQNLPWLDWLLEEGDSIIIFGWDVEYGPFGRSGGGHMVGEGAFSIDPRYSGTPSNNFVTRAIARISEDVLKIMME